MTPDTVYIEPHFLPCIEYIHKIKGFKRVVLDSSISYNKNTYLNRAYIQSANKTQLLSIPVEKGRHNRGLIKEVKIAYHENWAKQHLKTLKSAYGNSSFYEYYIDIFEPLWVKQYLFLIDLITVSTTEMIRILLPGAETQVLEEGSISGNNFSNTIMPGDRQSFFHPAYYQVFEHKLGFQNNLSSIDLVFNLGPDAKKYVNDI